MKRLAKYLALIMLAVMTIGIAAFVMGMRRKSAFVLNAARKMNKAVVNPDQMATAGKPGAYASIIKHRGRASGKEYETPVQARSTETGFVIPLPYGESADWLKNVMAEGSATIVNEGSTFTVDHPELVGGQVAEPYIHPEDLKMQRLVGVDTYLQVRRVEPEKQPA